MTTPILIHASAVEMPDGAAIFLGPSGAGKSTITRLVTGAKRILADDKVWLIPKEDGTWAVADATHRFRGDVDFDAIDAVPLRSVYRIHKSHETNVVKISEYRTWEYLIESFWELWWQRRGQPLDTASMLRRVGIAVPGYNLYFTKEGEVKT